MKYLQPFKIVYSKSLKLKIIYMLVYTYIYLYIYTFFYYLYIFYYFIPICLNYLTLFFYVKNYFYCFFNISSLKSIIFYVELYLDGLYYRVKYYKEYHMLGFILGYNHYILYKLPLCISAIVHMKRRRFFLLSFDYLVLNLTMVDLVNLKYPNIYLGKGLRVRSKLYRKKPIIKKAYR